MTETGLTRRHAFVFAMGGLLLGSAMLAPSAQAASGISPPAGSMVLTRRLTRGLSGDAAIVVTRSWRITFSAQARGMAVSGEQISVTVEAPAMLAQLSKIEESRSTEGMFPILLAPDGRIVAAGEATSRTSFDAAVQVAQEMMAQQGFAQGSVSQHARFMAQLQQAGASLLDEWPADLFYPSTLPSQIVRQVELPDGGSGEFELRWEARTHPDNLLLHEARRVVITRIGSSVRQSSEDWTLVPV